MRGTMNDIEIIALVRRTFIAQTSNIQTPSNARKFLVTLLLSTVGARLSKLVCNGTAFDEYRGF